MKLVHRGMLLMFAFGGCWTAVELLANHLQQPYSSYEVIWVRYAVHLSLMLLVFGRRDPAQLLRTQRPAFQLARSLLMLAVSASWITARRFGVPLGTGTAVFWTSPLLIMALAAICLRERAPLWLWIAAATASAGAMLLAHPSLPVSGRHLLLPLVMAASFSLYVVMTRSLRTEPWRVNLFYTAFGVFLALLPVIPKIWMTPTPYDLALLVGVGLFSYAGFYVLDLSAAAIPVSWTATVTVAQMPLTLALPTLLGHVVFDGAMAVALVLVAAPCALVWWRGTTLGLQTAYE